MKPIGLHMVSAIAKQPDLELLAISGIGGIATWRDAAEYILLGATTVQVCTAVMHWGYRIVEGMIDGLSNYLDAKGMASVNELRGLSLSRVTDWKYLDLNYIIKARVDQEKCIGCGLCYIACHDGAHQAIDIERANGNSRVSIIEEACVGCNLCSLVCPVEGCITMVEQEHDHAPLQWVEYEKGEGAELIPRPKHGVTVS